MEETSTARQATVRRVLATVGAVIALGGFLAPLLLSSRGSIRHAWLVETITGFAAAGGGPLESEALLASIAIGIFSAVLAATIVLAVVLAVRPGSTRFALVVTIVAAVLLLGCVGAAYLVALLSGMRDGRLSVFSPAVTFAAVGGVLVLIAARWGATSGSSRSVPPVA